MTNQKGIKSTEQIKDITDDKSFVIPKSRGINTINPINDLKERNLLATTNIKNLNAADLQNRKVSILNGRTYLAR